MYPNIYQNRNADTDIEEWTYGCSMGRKSGKK